MRKKHLQVVRICRLNCNLVIAAIKLKNAMFYATFTRDWLPTIAFFFPFANIVRRIIQRITRPTSQLFLTSILVMRKKHLQVVTICRLNCNLVIAAIKLKNAIFYATFIRDWLPTIVFFFPFANIVRRIIQRITRPTSQLFLTSILVMRKNHLQVVIICRLNCNLVIAAIKLKNAIFYATFTRDWLPTSNDKSLRKRATLLDRVR